MILLDLSHTSHTQARTGVQRVCRSLFAALEKIEPVEPITFDPFQDAWRKLQYWERANLQCSTPSAKRSAQWRWQARWNGRLKRALNLTEEAFDADSALIVPEIFSERVGQALPRLSGRLHGPRLAIFHDAIALKYPELTPQKTVARFASYLIELSHFDGVAAVSEDSLQTLQAYWKWCGVANPPPLRKISLGVDLSGKPQSSVPCQAVPIILSVGSLEGRKNHLELLEASEQLWKTGSRFALRIVGMAHRETGKLALEKIAELQQAGRPLRYDGPVDDNELNNAYAECAFTVYPSLMEGFGLPVIESLRHAKPCICSGRGALGEAAANGGCLTVEAVTRSHLAEAISRLLNSANLRQKLTEQAAARTFTSWHDYARNLSDWTKELGQRGTRR